MITLCGNMGGLVHNNDDLLHCSVYVAFTVAAAAAAGIVLFSSWEA